MLILGCSSARWGSHKALPKHEGREGIQTEFGSKCQWGLARVLKPIWELHLYQMMDRRMKLEIRNRIFISCRGDRTRGAMAGSGLGGCGAESDRTGHCPGSGAPCSDWWEPA